MLFELSLALVAASAAVQQVQDVAVSRGVVVGVNRTQSADAATSRGVVIGVDRTSSGNVATSRGLVVGVFSISNANAAVSRGVVALSGPIPPDKVTVRLGRREAGDLASFAAQDGNVYRVCKFIVPNQTVPPVNVEVEAVSPDPVLGRVGLRTVARMTVTGSFQQRLELWDWSASRWDPTDTVASAISTTLRTLVVQSTGNANRYLDPNRRLRARYTVRPTGPVGTNAWCVETDQAVFLTEPGP